MPRNYYCDFCQCTFPDNVTNRRNHNEGASHVLNRKLHYDWYKDPNEFLQEQINKPPCRHYFGQGFCHYGLTCTHSHIKFDSISGQAIYPPELVQWFQAQQEEATEIKKNEKPAVVKEKRRYRLPVGWKVKDLPLSLKPPSSKHGYDWNNVGTW